MAQRQSLSLIAEELVVSLSRSLTASVMREREREREVVLGGTAIKSLCFWPQSLITERGREREKGGRGGGGRGWGEARSLVAQR